MASSLDLTPPGDRAHDGELSPLGQLGQQMGKQPSPDADAALLASTVLGQPSIDETRTGQGMPYAAASHGGQPTPATTKDPYESYKKSGRQSK
jgi:hypothetical protein